MDDHFLFYVAPDDIISNKVRFPEEEGRHIAKVLRKKSGDVIQVTDGLGHRMDVRLTLHDKKRVEGDIVATAVMPEDTERILAMGVIRQRDRLEFAIEKAVELGVTRIVLVHSDHAEKVSVKPSRVDKTIISAIKQSHRYRLPEWEERESFYEVLSEYRQNRRVITALAEEEGVRNMISENSPSLLLVGPEGGFSRAEIGHITAFGSQFIQLGKTRLRTETAVCALLSLLQCR